MERITTEMDNRGFSSTEYKTSSIKEVFTSVVEDLTIELRNELKEVKESLRNHRHEFTSDSVEAAELPALNTCTIFDEDEDAPASDDDSNDAVSNEVTKNQQPNKEKQLQKRKRLKKGVEFMKKRRLLLGFHHNKLNVLPRDYTFTPMSVTSFISMYLVGDAENNIPPLGTLRSSDVVHFKSKKGTDIGNRVRGKMKPFMKIVEKYARRKGVWIEKICDWTPALVTKMWGAISDEFEADFCKSNRTGELAWTTVFGRMTAANAFGNPRNKLEIAKRKEEQAEENNLV